MFGYIYKITNLINGKIYIGQHKLPDGYPDKLDEGYWGSGVEITLASKKYGRDNFSREIVCWANSFEELNDLEREYIRNYNSLDEKVGYNISDGGKNGNSTAGFSEDRQKLRLEKISEGNKNAWLDLKIRDKYIESFKNRGEEWKKKLSNLNKGKKSITKGRKYFYSLTEKKYKIANSCPDGYTDEVPEWFREQQRLKALGNKSRLGQKQSEDEKRKKSESLKKIIHTPEWNKKVSNALKGKKKSEEHKEKLRKPKPRYRWLKPDGSIIEMSQNNGIRHKDWIRLEQVIPDQDN